jgi:membrane protein involved in D-alanine export
LRPDEFAASTGDMRMAFYQGLLFFYIMGLLLIPAMALGVMEKPLRRYGFCATVVMLGCVFWGSGQLITLAAFYLWQMALCVSLLKIRPRTRPVLWLFVMLSLIPLAAVKLGAVAAMPGFIALLGISYMTFRAVQVIIDIHDGRITELRILDISYFLLFFPSVSAGPIDRYRRFHEDLTRRYSRAEYLDMLRRGVWKLVHGAFSSIVLSGLILILWLENLPANGVAATVSYMYGYTLYLFFNFAGYSSMAIGTAYILGIKLPENFNMPFLSVDMKDFWTRWHMSLSTWLRDYIYNRFVMRSLKEKWFKNPRTASYIGYFLTFTAMGAWHGLTPAFLLYGAYHGLLMGINEALDLHWKPFRKLKRQGRSQVVLVIITFHLFSFGLLIFSGRII